MTIINLGLKLFGLHYLLILINHSTFKIKKWKFIIQFRFCDFCHMRYRNWLTASKIRFLRKHKINRRFFVWVRLIRLWIGFCKGCNLCNCFLAIGRSTYWDGIRRQKATNWGCKKCHVCSYGWRYCARWWGHLYSSFGGDSRHQKVFGRLRWGKWGRHHSIGMFFRKTSFLKYLLIF